MGSGVKRWPKPFSIFFCLPVHTSFSWVPFWGEVYWNRVVCLFVCLSVRLSVDTILCALLLLQFLSNFAETLQESFLLYEVVHLQFSISIYQQLQELRHFEFYFIYRIYREQILCALLLLQFLSNCAKTLQESFLVYEVVHLKFSFLIYQQLQELRHFEFFSHIEYIGNNFCVRFFYNSFYPNSMKLYRNTSYYMELCTLGF